MFFFNFLHVAALPKPLSEDAHRIFTFALIIPLVEPEHVNNLLKAFL